MADHNSTPRTPFAGSFFSARQTSSSNDPNIVSMGPRCCLSLVLHLDGQLETFCAHGNAVLIRPSTPRERARLITAHRELRALLENMNRAMDAGFYSG